MRSLKVSFSAVSGAIFTTLAPLPLKNARTVPAQMVYRVSNPIEVHKLRSKRLPQSDVASALRSSSCQDKRSGQVVETRGGLHLQKP